MCPKVGVLTSVEERRGPDCTVGKTRHGQVRERAGVPRPVGKGPMPAKGPDISRPVGIEANVGKET